MMKHIKGKGPKSEIHPSKPTTAISLQRRVSCTLTLIFSKMEAAINTLVSQFKAFAGKEGSSHTLSKEEFQNLLTSQLPSYVKNSNDSAAIVQLMDTLDKDSDGELSFQEFWQFIGQLANQRGAFNK